jgi:asparagine synthetase B (glutamine-hydrolysing)
MAEIAGLMRLDGAPLNVNLRRSFFAECFGKDHPAKNHYESEDGSFIFLRECGTRLQASAPPARSPNNGALLYLAGEVFNEDLDLADPSPAILAAYEQEGDSLWRRLNGSYLLVLLEPAIGRYRIVTDRTASLTVFYRQNRNLLAFSSDLKPLLRLEGFSTGINATALTNFLTSGSILEGKSLLSDIECLRPGQVLTVEDSRVQIETYWSFSYSAQRVQKDPRRLEEELFALMMQAVARQTRDSRPLAVTLSGGYDSRSILACMRRLYPEREIHTVTWGEDAHRADSDAVIAQRTAQYYKTKHFFYPLRASALPFYFRDFVKTSEGRVDAAGNYPESLRIFEQIWKDLGVRILVRGNELFGARNKVSRERQAWFTAFIPDLTTLPYSYSCLKPEIRGRLADLGYQQMRRLYQELPYDDPIDRKDHLFIAQRWPGYQSPLTQLKRRIIEERNPYLDNDLMDFVSRLPGRYRTWKNLYVSTVQHQMPEFAQLGASQVISLIDWDAKLRTDRALQDFVREVLVERRNGFDELIDGGRLQQFLDKAFAPIKPNRRSLPNRIRRRIRKRLDRFELETSLEIFRLMIIKIWADEFLQGEFKLD